MSKPGRSKGISSSRWWLVSLLLFAAALRFGQLSTLPPGLHPDEARFGLAAWADNPTQLSQVMAALTLKLWGVTPWAVRASSAIAGVLLVWGTYLAAAALFPPEPKRTSRMPLAAAFTSAIFYPTVSLSRLGVGVLWGVALSTLAVACFWHGFNLLLTPAEPGHAGRRSHGLIWWQRLTLSPEVAFALTGVLLAAAAISNSWGDVIGRFLILFMFIPMLLRPEPWGAKKRSLVLLTGSFILVQLFRYVILGWPYPSFPLNGPSWPGFSQVIRGLFWSGTTELAYNLPGRPFLDAIQVILFLSGLVVTLRQGRQSRHLFLWLWLIVALLPALLTDDTRYWLMLPNAAAPLAILIAAGLFWLSNQLPVISHPLFNRPLVTGHGSLVTVYGLLAASALLSTNAYFNTYAQHPELAQVFAIDEWQLGQSAAAYPPETLLYLVPPSPNQATIQFALADPQRLWSFTPDTLTIPLGRLETPVLYLVGQEQAQLVAQLAEILPEATISDSPVPGYQFVYVPAFAPRLPQVHPTDLLWGGEIGLLDWQVVPVAGGVEVNVFWQAAANPSQNYVAYLHLLDEQGQLIAEFTKPLAGYPTGQWHRQEVIRGTFYLDALPSSDSYQLVTGILNPTSQTPIGETVLRNQD